MSFMGWMSRSDSGGVRSVSQTEADHERGERRKLGLIRSDVLTGASGSADAVLRIDAGVARSSAEIPSRDHQRGRPGADALQQPRWDVVGQRDFTQLDVVDRTDEVALKLSAVLKVATTVGSYRSGYRFSRQMRMT